MRNPILQEAAEVYIRRREYLLLHIFYAVGLALFTVMVWPSRGFMYFFRTESIPAVFQATVIAQVVAVVGISLTIGLDRLAEGRIIRYLEWIERTSVPVGVLFRGKIAVALVHTTFIVSLGIPFAVIAAGPTGTPIAAVLASEAIILLCGIAARVAGMIIAHLGELRYVVRVIGGWLFVAVFFVATIRFHLPLNPIAAVVRQHAEGSPFMRIDQTIPFWQNPLIASGVPLTAFVIVLGATFRFSLARHRTLRNRELQRDA